MPGANCVILDVQHSENIRMSYLEYQQKMMNVAHAGGKKLLMLVLEI